MVQVVTIRSRKSIKFLLGKRTGCVRQSSPEKVHELGVGEYILAAAGHFVEAFREVYLCFTLLDAGSIHGIVPVKEQFLSDETAQQRVYDEHPTDRKAVGILGAGVDDVGVLGLCGAREEESEGTCLRAFIDSLAADGIVNSR